MIIIYKWRHIFVASIEFRVVVKKVTFEGSKGNEHSTERLYYGG